MGWGDVWAETLRKQGHVANQGKRIPDRRNSEYKGSEAEIRLGCLKKSKEAGGEAKVQWAWERVLQSKVREVMVGADCALWVIMRLLPSPLRERSSYWTVLSGEGSWYDRLNSFTLAALLKTDYNSDKIVWCLNQDGSSEGCKQWAGSQCKKPQEVSQRAVTGQQQHFQRLLNVWGRHALPI